MTVREDEELRKALENLNQLIVERVERERRRDQLTGLPNGLALEETLSRHVDADRHVWAAFVEIDKFKSINDRFGYENADELLKAIATLLGELAPNFPGNAQVFRQHGDEFFIVGAHEDRAPHRADALQSLLEMACRKVAGVEIAVRASSVDSVPMSCTVSIGWLAAEDVDGLHTARTLLVCLEHAVDEAKRERNRAVRYTPGLARRTTIALRADCSECRTKFSADVPVAGNRADAPMRCPNCGADVNRPPVPVEPGAPVTPPIEV